MPVANYRAAKFIERRRVQPVQPARRAPTAFYASH